MVLSLGCPPRDKNSMCTHLLAHGATPLKILILLDFMVQVNIDVMPVKVFTHTAAWLMNVLTVAEATPGGNNQLLRSPNMIVIAEA